MTDLRTAEIGGIQWWAETREFANPSVAKLAFKRLQDYGQRLRGELHVGTYRHDNENEEFRYVTVVGYHKDGVERALRALGGTPIEIHPELLTRMVYRRARVVEAMREGNAAPGAYRFPHPDAVKIDPLGNLEQ